MNHPAVYIKSRNADMADKWLYQGSVRVQRTAITSFIKKKLSTKDTDTKNRIQFVSLKAAKNKIYLSAENGVLLKSEESPMIYIHFVTYWVNLNQEVYECKTTNTCILQAKRVSHDYVTYLYMYKRRILYIYAGKKKENFHFRLVLWLKWMNNYRINDSSVTCLTFLALK